MPLKHGEGEAFLWPPGASLLGLFSTVSANCFQHFLKQRMYFDIMEHDFKPEIHVASKPSGYWHDILQFTCNLKIENLWLPKMKVFLLNSQMANVSSFESRRKKTAESHISKTWRNYVTNHLPNPDEPSYSSLYLTHN